jgi:hypothetical protein
MPLWLDDLDDAGEFVGLRWSGIYQRLLRGQCETECEPDPRLMLGQDDPSAWADFEAEQAEGRDRAEELFVERLADARPLTAARWRVLGGPDGVPRREAPEWLRKQSLREVVVYVDDSIIPAP